MTARMLNGFLQSDIEALTPLVTPHTNVPIANFPATSASLGRMTWPQKRALGTGLGLTAPANNATAAQQRAFLVQIRVAVGLRPSPA
ncbi:hypothetical protein DL95DRAFT_471846 [Leptodontidium sp. 2 PMI_412]|nr:hypothetical protein DL95DRAFT_471846 [Leptodontidium sp. 2 PMI_412]